MTLAYICNFIKTAPTREIPQMGNLYPHKKRPDEIHRVEKIKELNFIKPCMAGEYMILIHIPLIRHG